MTLVFAPPVVLGPADSAQQRTFAHPDHVAGDRAVLAMLCRDVVAHVEAAEGDDPLVCFVPSRAAWHRRVVIPRRRALLGDGAMTLVGFFGRVRDAVDPEVAERISALGEALAEAVLTAPGVLAYSTHLLADERNYANLVLVSTPEVIDTWRTTAPHPAAAGEWSPRYYAHVRIYRGSVERRHLHAEGAVRLEAVKYWDYRCDPVWQAVRTLT